MTRAKDISKILTDADISGNIDVDGVTNLDVVDIDGAVDMASTLTVGGAFTSLGIDDNADATAMTISSDEDVMIGTTDESSGAKFIVGSTSDDKRGFFQGSNQYRVGLKNGSNNHVFIGSGGADNFRVSRHDGSTSFEVNGDGNIVLPVSGTGIHLGVTSATASNLLSDYEEGTWTPAIVDLSNTPTFHGSTGRYTKVGRVCTVQFFQQTNQAPTFNNANHAFKIGGLPFAVFGSGYTGSQGSVSAQAFNYHGSNNNQSVSGSGSNGGCYLTASVNTVEQKQFQVTNSGGTRGEVNNAGATQGYIIEATVTYFTSN